MYVLIFTVLNTREGALCKYSFLSKILLIETATWTFLHLSSWALRTVSLTRVFPVPWPGNSHLVFLLSLITSGSPHLPYLLILEEFRICLPFLSLFISLLLSFILISILMTPKFISLAWISPIKYTFKVLNILLK